MEVMPEYDNFNEVLVWHNTFFASHDATRNSEAIDRLLQIYVEQMQSNLPKFLNTDPEYSKQITRNVTNILNIFHNRKEEFGLDDNDQYFELMTDALAIYCDLRIQAYLSYTERVEDISINIIAVLRKFLNNDVMLMVNVTLKMRHLKYGRHVFEMIFEFLEKKLDFKECRKSIYTYVRYILFYRQWKRLYNDISKLKEITEKAIKNIKEPPGFRTHPLFNIIRPGPIIPMYLTKHLLTARIDTVAVSKKFFQYVKEHPIPNETRDVSDFIDLTFEPTSPEVKDEDRLSTSSPISTSNNRTNSEISLLDIDHSRVPPPIANVLGPLDQNRSNSPTQLISSLDRQMILNETPSRNENNCLNSVTSSKNQDNRNAFNSLNKSCDNRTSLDHRNDILSSTWQRMPSKSTKNEMRAPDSVDTGISSDRSLSESCSPPYVSEIREDPFWARPASTSTEPIVTKVTSDIQSDLIIIPDSPQHPCGVIDDSIDNTPSSTTHASSTESAEVAVGNDVNISSAENLLMDNVNLSTNNMSEDIVQADVPSPILDIETIESSNTFTIDDRSPPCECDFLEENLINSEKVINTNYENEIARSSEQETETDGTVQDTSKSPKRKIVFTQKFGLPVKDNSNVSNIECDSLLRDLTDDNDEIPHNGVDLNTSSSDFPGFSGFSNILESQDDINPPPSPHDCSKHLKTITKSITEECSKLKSIEKSKHVASDDQSSEKIVKTKSILKSNKTNNESGSSSTSKRVFISNERSAQYIFTVDENIEAEEQPITYDGKLKSATGKEFNINTVVHTVQTKSAIAMEMAFHKTEEDRARASTTDKEAELSPVFHRGRSRKKKEEKRTYTTRSRSRERSPGLYKSLNEVELVKRSQSLSLSSPSKNNYRTRSQSFGESSYMGEDLALSNSEVNSKQPTNKKSIGNDIKKSATKRRRKLSFEYPENISEDNLNDALRYRFNMETLPFVSVDRLTLPSNLLFDLLRKKFNCENLPLVMVKRVDTETLKKPDNKRIKTDNTTRPKQVERIVRFEDYTSNSTSATVDNQKRGQSVKRKSAEQSQSEELQGAISFPEHQNASSIQYILDDSNTGPGPIKYVTSPYRVTTDPLSDSTSQNETTFNKFISSFNEQPIKNQRKYISKKNKQPMKSKTLTSDMLFDQIKNDTNNTVEKSHKRPNQNKLTHIRTSKNASLSTSRPHNDSKKLNSVGFRSKKPPSCLYTNLDTNSSVDSSTSEETGGLIVSNEVTIEDNEDSIPKLDTATLSNQTSKRSRIQIETETGKHPSNEPVEIPNENAYNSRLDSFQKLSENTDVDDLVTGVYDGTPKPENYPKINNLLTLSRSSSATSISSKNSSITSSTQTKQVSYSTHESCSSLSSAKRIFSEEGSVHRKSKKAEYVKSFRHVDSNDTFTIDPHSSTLLNTKNVASKPTSIVKPTVHKSPTKELFLEKEAELDLQYIERKKKTNIKKNTENSETVHVKSTSDSNDSNDQKFKLRIKLSENSVIKTKQDGIIYNNLNFKNSVISAQETMSATNCSSESTTSKNAVSSNDSAKAIESKKKNPKKNTKKELPFKKRGPVKTECVSEQVYDKPILTLLNPMLSIADIEGNEQLNVGESQSMLSRQFKTPAELKEVIPIVLPFSNSAPTHQVVPPSDYTPPDKLLDLFSLNDV